MIAMMTVSTGSAHLRTAGKPDSPSSCPAMGTTTLNTGCPADLTSPDDWMRDAGKLYVIFVDSFPLDLPLEIDAVLIVLSMTGGSKGGGARCENAGVPSLTREQECCMHGRASHSSIVC